MEFKSEFNELCPCCSNHLENFKRLEAELAKVRLLLASQSTVLKDIRVSVERAISEIPLLESE